MKPTLMWWGVIPKHETFVMHVFKLEEQPKCTCNTIITVKNILLECKLLSPFRLERHAPWCNGYRCRKWSRRHEFKSWTRLFVFHIVLIPLENV